MQFKKKIHTVGIGTSETNFTPAGENSLAVSYLNSSWLMINTFFAQLILSKGYIHIKMTVQKKILSLSHLKILADSLLGDWNTWACLWKLRWLCLVAEIALVHMVQAEYQILKMLHNKLHLFKVSQCSENTALESSILLEPVWFAPFSLTNLLKVLLSSLENPSLFRSNPHWV